VNRRFGIESPIWDLKLRGTFLTDQETNNFLEKIKSFQASQPENLVLPELPALPPRSRLQIEIYGDFGLTSGNPSFLEDIVNADISVQGASYKIQRISEIEGSWIVDWYQNPYKAFPLLSFLILIIYGLAVSTPWLWKRVRIKIIAQEAPNIIKRAIPIAIYNLACQAAIAQEADEAMILLKKAFEEGFSDKEYAKQDPNLNLLQQRDDFQKLVQ
jgi:hypothetical protein